MDRKYTSGTLAVVLVTPEGLVLSSDSLEKAREYRRSRQKIFRIDARTACLLGMAGAILTIDEKEIKVDDLRLGIEEGSRRVEHVNDLTFEEKCQTVTACFGSLLQESKARTKIPFAAIGQRAVSTLYFFGYSGKKVKSGVFEFRHDKEELVIQPGLGVVWEPSLFIFGPKKTICELRQGSSATYDIYRALPVVKQARQQKGEDLVKLPHLRLVEARELAQEFLRASIELPLDKEPELAGPIQLAEIPHAGAYREISGFDF